MSKKILILILPLLFTAAIVLPFVPILEPVPSRDSGVFQYIGWRILEGELPYVDIWDHKGPLIYFINAFAQFISGGSSWGLWFVFIGSLITSFYVYFKLLLNKFDLKVAFFGVLIFAVNIQLLGGDLHYAELFAVPLQLLSVYLFFGRPKSKAHNIHLFIAGILGGLVFFLKPNLIGIWIGYLIYLLVKNFVYKKSSLVIKSSSLLIGGGALVLGAFALLFSLNNALTEMVNQYIVYNSAYASPSIGQRVRSISDGFIYLNDTKTLFFALTGYVLLLLFIFSKSSKKKIDNFALFIAVLFPVEIILSTLSGRSFSQYFLAWALPVSYFAAYFLHYVDVRNNLKKNFHFYILLLIFIGNTFIRVTISQTTERMIMRNGFNVQLVEYIKQNTSEFDHVLVWGADVGVNYAAKRSSPSRFAYQYALYTPGYSSSALIDQFRNEIITKQPPIIVDAADHTDRVLPLEIGRAILWTPRNIDYFLPPDMLPLVEDLNKQYVLVETLDKYRIYAHINHPIAQPALEKLRLQGIDFSQ